ncbi:MAG: hypothetical protein GY909_15975 [Oligoflexia bacterium]|nr:hypothetical protein [Oligoflexia bacterium]
MEIFLSSKENSDQFLIQVKKDDLIIHQRLHHINDFRKDEIHSFDFKGLQKNYTTYDNGELLQVCLHSDSNVDIARAISFDSVKDPFSVIFIA